MSQRETDNCANCEGKGYYQFNIPHEQGPFCTDGRYYERADTFVPNNTHCRYRGEIAKCYLLEYPRCMKGR